MTTVVPGSSENLEAGWGGTVKQAQSLPLDAEVKDAILSVRDTDESSSVSGSTGSVCNQPPRNTPIRTRSTCSGATPERRNTPSLDSYQPEPESHVQKKFSSRRMSAQDPLHYDLIVMGTCAAQAIEAVSRSSTASEVCRAVGELGGDLPSASHCFCWTVGQRLAYVNLKPVSHALDPLPENIHAPVYCFLPCVDSSRTVTATRVAPSGGKGSKPMTPANLGTGAGTDLERQFAEFEPLIRERPARTVCVPVSFSNIQVFSSEGTKFRSEILSWCASKSVECYGANAGAPVSLDDGDQLYELLVTHAAERMAFHQQSSGTFHVPNTNGDSSRIQKQITSRSSTDVASLRRQNSGPGKSSGDIARSSTRSRTPGRSVEAFQSSDSNRLLRNIADLDY